MAAHAGILYAHARPVPCAVVEALSRGNRALGPDRPGVHVADGVALLSFALHVDALAIREQQPVRTADDAMLTWDGRLDNRDDLLVRLTRTLAGEDTDARLVAQALTAWGDDALDQIVGDWSLVRWEPRSRELMLACDYAGNRTLHYCQRPDYVAWSTAIEPLVVLCGLAGEVDDVYMASFLTQQPPDGRTPFRDLQVVRPGEVVRVAAGRPARCRTYAQVHARAVRYADEQQYEEHYRHVFTDAVRVRLRARAPVWTELSGGYDSSAIACVAAALVRARAVEAPAVQPVSLDLSGIPESDESAYVRAVDDHCGLQTVWMPFAGTLNGRLPSVTVGDLIGDAGGDADGELLTGDRAHVAGSHVLLCGSIGDSISEPVETRDLLFDHLQARRWRAFFADSLAHARAMRTPLYEAWRPVWRLGLSLAHREQRMQHERLDTVARERLLDTRDPARLFALRPDFLRRSLRPPVSFAEGLDGLPRHAQHFLLWLRASAADGRLRADTRSRGALRMTFPFAHRPLVDFVLAVPPAIMWHPVRHRAFVCRAMADVLPPAVLSRQSKGDGTSSNSRHLAPQVMALQAACAAATGTGRQMRAARRGTTTPSQLVERGYADPASLEALCRGFLDGTESTVLLVKRLIVAETMLRQMSQTSERSHTSEVSGAQPAAAPADHPPAIDSLTIERR